MDSKSRAAGPHRPPTKVSELRRNWAPKLSLRSKPWTTGRAGIGGSRLRQKTRRGARAQSANVGDESGAVSGRSCAGGGKGRDRPRVFLSFAVDDAARAPVIIFAGGGGTGIEERASATRRIPCDVNRGPLDSAVDEAVASCGLSANNAKQLNESIRKLFAAARSVEARSLEINPLALTKSGEFVAADCRITIDDYAVARHPELGIEIAREFDHPPTALEQVAYPPVEQNDHRGTFYFAQLATAAPKGSKGLVGFHGAGGGGSMMSMDAIVNAGFTIANFTDTSGNPSASKVYRAARIILAQPDLVGYFGSGSGGCEPGTILVRVRFGEGVLGTRSRHPRSDSSRRQYRRSSGRDLHRMSKLLRAAGRRVPQTDTPAFIAARFAELVTGAGGKKWKPRTPQVPKFVNDPSATKLAVKNGRVWIDTARLAGDPRRS